MDNMRLIINTFEVLNTLAERCYTTARNKGFWEDEDKILRTLDDIQSTDFKVDKDQYEKQKKRIVQLFNSEKIALEHSELSERLEILRKDPGKMDEHCPKFLNIEIECADLIIRCLDFCGRRNLRIGEALIAKMTYNESRPYKHDKNF